MWTQQLLSTGICWYGSIMKITWYYWKQCKCLPPSITCAVLTAQCYIHCWSADSPSHLWSMIASSFSWSRSYLCTLCSWAPQESYEPPVLIVPVPPQPRQCLVFPIKVPLSLIKRRNGDLTLALLHPWHCIITGAHANMQTHWWLIGGRFSTGHFVRLLYCVVSHVAIMFGICPVTNRYICPWYSTVLDEYYVLVHMMSMHTWWPKELMHC